MQYRALVALALAASAFAACGGTTPVASPTDAGGDGASPTSTATGVVTVPPNGSTGCGKVADVQGFADGKEVTAQSRTRKYAITLPEGYDTSKAYPLVYVFHGDGGNGAGMRQGIKLEDQAKGGAIFVYPDGLNQTWNLDSAPSVNGDVQLFDAILETVGNKYCVDKKRIFVTGFSRGGYFANQLACWRGDVIRAAASNGSGGPYGVEGSKFDNNGNLECPTPGIPAIVFHGASDAPAEGQKTLDHFVRANSCPDKSKTTDVSPSPCKSVDGCTDGRSVVWCLVPGLGHQIWSESDKATWSFFSKL